MKFLKFLTVSGLLFLAPSPAGAAALLVDPFTEGAFSLAYLGATTDVTLLNNSFAYQRSVRGSGVKDWTASVQVLSGTLSYSVDLRGTPPATGGNKLELEYFLNQDPVSLLGEPHLLLRVTGLTGLGDLVAGFGPVNEGNAIPIIGEGDIIYPISSFSGNAQFLQISFVARSADFSITVDEIALVPEPSAGVLAVLAGGWCLTAGTRRRPGEVKKDANVFG